MIYYRLALKDRQTATWQWKTTALTSLHAVLQLLRSYKSFPQDHIRVFTSTSKEDLHEMLKRENNGLASGSVTAAQFLCDRHMLVQEQAQDSPDQGITGHVAQSPLRSTASYSPLRQYSVAEDRNSMSPLDQRRLEIELGPGGDHDIPYIFSLPSTVPQFLAWTKLQSRVQMRELPL